MEIDSQKLSELLKKLANSIKKKIGAELSNGSLKSEDEVHFKWKLDKFVYDDGSK